MLEQLVVVQAVLVTRNDANILRKSLRHHPPELESARDDSENDGRGWVQIVTA